MNNNDINTLRWASLATALTLPFIAWGQYYNWNLNSIGILQLFGLLGVTAWSIMATHFIVHAFSSHSSHVIHKNKLYSRVSGYCVLGLILMHPALLYLKQFSLGNGLPPFSSIKYVGQDLAVYLVFGVLALTIFLAYEVWQNLTNKSFFVKNYFWIFILQYFAMIFVFIHASQLGKITQVGWFSIIWAILGIAILLSALVSIPYEWKLYQQKDNRN